MGLNKKKDEDAKSPAEKIDDLYDKYDLLRFDITRAMHTVNLLAETVIDQKDEIKKLKKKLGGKNRKS